MEDDEEKITIDITGIDGEVNTITISQPISTVNVGDIWLDNSTMNSSMSIDSSWLTIDDTIDLDSITSNITFNRVMFEDDMPDPQELKEMCEEYPALEKVYENFKTVYKMVEQDWRGKQDSDEDTLF